MKKLFVILAAIAVIGCGKKESQLSQQTEKAIDSKQLSDAEMERLATKVTDSVADAVDFEASYGSEGMNPKVEEAKKLIDEAHGWMIKSIKGEISADAANSKIKPAMQKFNNINSDLADFEKKYLENYRTDKINEAIDLQIKYGK